MNKAVMAVCCWLWFPAVGAATAPDIVVIMLDDVHWSQFGAYADHGLAPPAAPVSMTPDLDALAAAGAFYPDGVVQSICKPTHAMLWSGLQSDQYADRIQSGFIEPGATLPCLLAAAGYRSFLAGKPQWLAGNDPTRYCMDGGAHDGGQYDIGAVVDWVLSVPSSTPALLMIQPRYPHPQDQTPPPAARAAFGDRSDALLWEANNLVAETLAAFRAARQGEPLVIWVGADNGYGVKNSKGRGVRSWSGRRTPIAVTGPGVVPGVYPDAGSALDVVPTALAAAGVAAPAGLDYDGADIRAGAAGASVFWRCDRNSLCGKTRKLFARRDGWTVYAQAGRRGVKVSHAYRVDVDPYETENVVKSSEYNQWRDVHAQWFADFLR